MFFYFVDKHFCEDTCLTETYAQVYKGVECNDCILLSSLWLAIYPSDRLPVTSVCYYPYMRSSIKVKNTQGHSFVNEAPIKKRKGGVGGIY